MDKKTAEIILNLNQFETPVEAYEYQLFKLRNYLFLNPVIPTVYYGKIKKAAQLFGAVNHFIKPDNQFIKNELIPLSGLHLFDKFVCYEENKSHIKKNLSKFLTAKNLETGMNDCIKNLSLWYKEIEHVDTINASAIPTSRELDVLTTFKLFKQLKENPSSPYDARLISEIRRIQLLEKTIEY